MSPRLTARLLVVAAAALLAACSNPVAPGDAAFRTDTDPASACGGVFGGVSTRQCSDTTVAPTATSTMTTTETSTLSACGGVFGGVSTRSCDEDGN